MTLGEISERECDIAIQSILWQLRDHPHSSAITNHGRSKRSQGTGALGPLYISIVSGHWIIL